MVLSLIDQLKDPSDTIRSAAAKQLMGLARSGTATLEDAVAMIKAATGAFPPHEHAWQDPTATLLFAARDIARDKDPSRLLPTIEKHFPSLTPSARIGALQILVMTASPAAADLYARLLEQHGAAVSYGSVPQFEPSAGADVGAVLFPRLIALARDRELAYPILSTLLEFRNAGVVPPDVAHEHHGSLALVLKAELDRARALQRPRGTGWRDESPYVEHRDMGGMLIDLAGTLSSERLLRVVESAGDLPDPRLRRFRAVTLLRRGRPVDEAELDWIGASPRDRYWLFRQLHRLEMADRLPAACLDQAKLAEGHMVDWLCFGTELGREPDEIELIHVESRARSDARLLVRWLSKRQMVDYYFFRYRVTEEHWAQKDGWMVGMAGGYARTEQPTTAHDGGTFSKFGSFESKSIAEHVADYLE